jgi:hypothetical protein
MCLAFWLSPEALATLLFEAMLLSTTLASAEDYKTKIQKHNNMRNVEISTKV